MTATHRRPSILRRFHGLNRALRSIRSRSYASLARSDPGAWIFTDPVVEWTYDYRLRSQLPLPYRLFSYYAQLHHLLGNRGSIVGGLRCFQLMRWVVRRFWRRSTSRRLELPDGTRIYVNLLDPRFFQVIREVSSEENRSLLEAHLEAGDTFIDIGANHGSFSVIAAGLLNERGMIIAVEPQPFLARLIERSLQCNATCHFEVVQAACGETEGRVRLFVPVGTSGAAGVFEVHSARYHHRVLSVPMLRFDDCFDGSLLPGRVFLKLDVEGSELAFMKGAQRLLLQRRPAIFMEINECSLAAAGLRAADLQDFLIECGYRRFVDPRSGEVAGIEHLGALRRTDVVLLAEEADPPHG